MNTENNKRYQNTEERILGAYSHLAGEKLLANITVSDICRLAGIHRTSFYRHYQDIPELQRKVTMMQMGKLLELFAAAGQWDLREGLVAQLSFFERNKDVVKRNFDSLTDVKRLSQSLSLQTNDHFHEEMCSRYHCRSEAELEYQKEFLTMGSLAVLKKWLRSDCKESPEEIADILIRNY